MPKIAGGCLCGAVRYEIDAEPITTRLCWCRTCQYFTTGNAAVSVAFPSARISISGETHDYQSAADSGSRMHRRFCPRCGTHMFSEAEPRPHLIFVRAGSLDDPNIARPERRSGRHRLRNGPASMRACQAGPARRRPRPEDRLMCGPLHPALHLAGGEGVPVRHRRSA